MERVAGLVQTVAASRGVVQMRFIEREMTRTNRGVLICRF
jgi:hypothetical protein